MFIEDAAKLREEIYARHGKIYTDHWTQRLFPQFQNGTSPIRSSRRNSLSAVEKKNVATISAL